MTKTQRAVICERIKKEGAAAVAKDAEIAELTLLRVLLESEGVHPGSVALLDQFAQRIAR